MYVCMYVCMYECMYNILYVPSLTHDDTWYIMYVGAHRGRKKFLEKYPKNTDILPILGMKFSTKIVQKGYDFIFFL